MTLRIIQVGMGGWGRNWMRQVIGTSTEVELVACVETIPEILDLAREHMPPTTQTFTDLEEALQVVESDAVLITANLAGHIPSALTALKAGKHVLLEKPFAPSISEARAAVEMAEQQQRILMISQNYRYHPAVQGIRELLRSQELGPVGSVKLDFRRYANTAPRGSDHKHYALWQPLLADMAIHHFDLMRYILGQEAAQIYCHAWNPSWSNFDGPASAVASITFGDGNTLVDYNGSWVSTGPQTQWAGEWHIDCAKGEIIMSSREDNQPDYLAIRPLGEKLSEVTLPGVDHLDRSGCLHAFVEAVQSGKQPGSSGRDNLNTLALMFSAVASSEQGLPIKLL